MSFQKIYRALRAQTDFKISWRRWTGINSIFCWLVKRGEVNMEENFSHCEWPQVVPKWRFNWSTWCWNCCWGGHCTNVCQTWSFMHIRTGYVRYISVWKMCLFKFFSCYMPTSWEPYHEVEQMYDLMELLLSNCERVGASAVVGGDFNAMLGDCREADDRDVPWNVWVWRAK